MVRVGGRNGKRFKVHRLVAEHFLPEPTDELKESITNSQNGVEVNHIDGDKCNNILTNLEWSNGKDNMSHAYALGLLKTVKGENNPNSKLTPSDIEDILQLRKQGKIYRVIAEQYGVTIGMIGHICKGRNWK